jgi:ADP-ribose pyrophosphatase
MTLIRHDVVFRGRVFVVERDVVTLPNGATSTLDIVRHRGSVVLLPCPSPGELVLVRQYRHAIGRWIWELPAGTLEAGEDPADAARRECEEEIGRTPGSVERLAAYYPTPGFCDELMTFYLCADLGPLARPATPDEDEQLEPRTVTLAEAGTMLEQGEIVDMKTVVGLTLLRERLGRAR